MVLAGSDQYGDRSRRVDSLAAVSEGGMSGWMWLLLAALYFAFVVGLGSFLGANASDRVPDGR